MGPKLIKFFSYWISGVFRGSKIFFFMWGPLRRCYRMVPKWKKIEKWREKLDFPLRFQGPNCARKKLHPEFGLLDTYQIDSQYQFSYLLWKFGFLLNSRVLSRSMLKFKCKFANSNRLQFQFIISTLNVKKSFIFIYFQIKSWIMIFCQNKKKRVYFDFFLCSLLKIF